MMSKSSNNLVLEKISYIIEKLSSHFNLLEQKIFQENLFIFKHL